MKYTITDYTYQVDTAKPTSYSAPVKVTISQKIGSNATEQVVSSTWYEYSSDYRFLTRETDVFGASTQYFYDGYGNLTRTIDPNGNTVWHVYDNANQLVKTTMRDPNNPGSSSATENEFAYQTHRLTDIMASNTQYHFGYDSFGRSSSISIQKENGTASRTLAEYEYNNTLGLLSKLTYGNGISQHYNYDSRGRITGIRYEPDQDGMLWDYLFEYNENGQVQKVDDLQGGQTWQYTYDDKGRLTEAADGTGNQIGVHFEKQSTTQNLFYRFPDVNIWKTIIYESDPENHTSQTSIQSTKITDKTDIQGRLQKHSLVQAEKELYSEYTYQTATWNGVTYNTDRIASITLKQKNSASATPVTLSATSYEYDNNGNITKVWENGDLAHEYTYDSKNQLFMEIDYTQSPAVKTYYVIDNNGNINSKMIFNHVTGSLIKQEMYGYQDSTWQDLLTSYNGQAITYDAIGNPLSYLGKTLSWVQGRRLGSVQTGGTTWNYTYNADGLRTKKNVNGSTASTEYIWLDNQLLAQYTKNGENRTDRMSYYYDAAGSIQGFTYEGVDYWYVKNVQGDVVAIVNQVQETVAWYVYDSWGKLLRIENGSGQDVTNDTTHIGYKNPFRYRGYYYDNETGWYYLQSRYYDPEVGRFINADGQLNPGLLGNNLFAYCENNPVNRYDPTGHFWDYFFDGAFLVWSIVDIVKNPRDWKNWAALGIDIVFAVIPFVPSGAGQTIKIGNKIDNAIDVANAINKLDNISDIGKLTMIGRSMDRVTDTAKIIDKADDLYVVWKGYGKVASFSKPLANAISAIHDGNWLFGKLRKGYSVIDIGITTMHKGRGLWYGTEKFVLAMWKTRNLWKFPINHFS